MRHLVLVTLLSAFSAHAALTPTPVEISRLQAWLQAKFEARTNGAAPTSGQIIVLANHGAVQANGRAGRPLRLGQESYTRGLYCHAPSRLSVRLPAPAKSFTALVGVDSNENTVGGRGSVDFVLLAGEGEAFRSGVMTESSPAKALKLDLNGAREVTLIVEETPDGISCDQADWADAKFQLADGTSVYLSDLPLSDGKFEPCDTDPPFSFTFGGKDSKTILASWKSTHESEKLDPKRTRHSRRWVDPASGLEVLWEAVEYADYPVIEWVVKLKNTGAADTPVISNLQAADFKLATVPWGETFLHYTAGDDCRPESYAPGTYKLDKGVERTFEPAGGRPTSVSFPYFNLEWPDRGVIFVVGWPGQWSSRFAMDEAGAVRLQGAQQQTHFVLHPGEEARTPLIALQFWNGNRLRAQNLWRRWMVAHNLPRTKEGKPPPPILSSCSGGFFPGIRTSEAGERLFIEAFEKAGIKLDYWWIDAGWYACSDWPQTGTWVPDPVRYPKGFKPISDLAHSKGMGLIVWFEPERVTPGTFLYTNNPAWLLGKDGEQKLLNMGNPEARRWLTDYIDSMLTRQGIDLYRQDHNIDPLAFWRGADAPDRQGITEMRYVEGYLAFFDELRRRHPGLLIDSCASGGRRNDLETMRRAIPLLRSDYQAFDGNPSYAPGNQGHTYGLSSWLPYYGQGVYFSQQDYLYSVRSYLSPATALAADPRRPDVDWSLVRSAAEEWREAAPCMLGDFYPLTPHGLDDSQWIAWQFDLPEEGRGIVQVFRRTRSPYEAARFKLHGLDPKTTYFVSNSGKTERTGFSGSELMDRGLLVAMPQQPSGSILTYNKSRKVK